MTDLDKLIDIYFTHEPWHSERLSRKEIEKYFISLVVKQRLIAVKDKIGNIVSYCESWRINKDQLDRVTAGKPFAIQDEDINTGSICFIHTVWIDKHFRGNGLLRKISQKLKDDNKECSRFVWERRGKDDKLRIYNRRA